LIGATMAKKPQGSMDEEEIIKRRDDVEAANPDRPLDIGARRALADARLRALAFTLGAKQDSQGRAAEIGDADLLVYLLDTLRDDRRKALEEAFRGDAAVFGRLMTLRAALDSHVDQRDRHRADDPSRKIPRHTVGRIDIRSAGEVLQFRDARIGVRHVRQLGMRVRRPERLETRIAAAVADFEISSFAFRVQRGEKTEGMLRDVLERAWRDFDTGKDLISEARSFLERWWQNVRSEELEPRDTGGSHRREAEEVRERLTELLRELEIIGRRINDEVSSIASAMKGMILPPPLPPRAGRLTVTRVTGAPPLLTDRETWTDAFEMHAGPWALHLSGTVVPTPQLSVTLRGNREGTASIEPLLTMVRPAENFETVHLDSHGSGRVALLSGRSIMLLQGDEVWVVHLSFRNS
jgi:hypothetical protein